MFTSCKKIEKYILKNYIGFLSKDKDWMFHLHLLTSNRRYTKTLVYRSTVKLTRTATSYKALHRFTVKPLKTRH